MNPIKIHIPEPCHENWENMSAGEKGRFCQSCQKLVYDFTKLSDRAIAAKMNSGENICGRFADRQLNRELMVPKRKSPVWAASMTSILSLLSGINELHAQAKPQTVQTNPDRQPESETLGKVVSNQNIICGKIIEGDYPVPGAMVQVKGTATATRSDMDGRFSIAAKEGDILVVSFLGMKVEEIQVSRSKNLEVLMQNDYQKMGEVVVVKKRTFLGHAFHSIGNWLR